MRTLGAGTNMAGAVGGRGMGLGLGRPALRPLFGTVTQRRQQGQATLVRRASSRQEESAERKTEKSEEKTKSKALPKLETRERLQDLTGTLELNAEATTTTTTQEVETKETTTQQRAFVRQSLCSQLTGGVQYTTSTKDLPSSEVAVRNLMEYAKFAHMSTVMSKAQHRRAGYPFGSIVEFAVDAEGSPVFAMSSLAIHTRNVLANPRCAIQIHAPGWTGLNNARVTLFGDVYPVTEESKKDANELFASKRRRMKPRTEQTNEKRSPQDSSTIPLANTRYFVMGKIVDVLFVGGYGTVTWITPEQYAAAEPDFILQDLSQVVHECNQRFSRSIRKLMPEADDVVFISVDKRGVELRVRIGSEDTVRRIKFNEHCYSAEDVVKQLEEIIET